MSRRYALLNYWVFFALALTFGVIAVFSLRANNLHAIALRNEVLLVDKNNGDVEAALQKLRVYVYSHMDTDLSSGSSVYPPVQLKFRYDRLVAAEKERVQAEMAKVYTDAQKLCEQQNSTDFSGRNRVPCIEQYVTNHTITERPIADDVYKFAFASPDWSPDLAGLSLLAAGTFAVMGSLLLVVKLWLHGRRL